MRAASPHHRLIQRPTDIAAEVRMALLEADVALPVACDFIARAKERRSAPKAGLC